MSLAGQWKKQVHTEGADSNLRTIEYNRHNPLNHSAHDLLLAEVVLPQPEPAYKQHMVTVDFVRGGSSSSVAWPGPAVNLSKAGIPTGMAQAIHGVFEAPMPGQMVLVGFENGNANSPVVVQKYPYNPSQRTDVATAYFLPMTTIGHGPTDVVVGHYLGSYLAFRGGPLGLPGSVEISAPTNLDIYALTGIQAETHGEFSVTAGIFTFSDILGNSITTSAIGVTIEDMSGNTIKMQPGGVSITDVSGNSIETTATGITINGGVTIL